MRTCVYTSNTAVENESTNVSLSTSTMDILLYKYLPPNTHTLPMYYKLWDALVFCSLFLKRAVSFDAPRQCTHLHRHCLLLVGVNGPCKAKVAYLDSTVAVNENVAWLEVSVDDPCCVQVLDPWERNDGRHQQHVRTYVCQR